MKCINSIKSRNYAVGAFFIILVNSLVSVCHLYRVSHLVCYILVQVNFLPDDCARASITYLVLCIKMADYWLVFNNYSMYYDVNLFSTRCCHECDMEKK